MYYSTDKFIHDVFTLKNTIVFITDVVEYELSTLDNKRYKFIKNKLEKNNIKVVVIKKDSSKKLKVVGRCK